MSQYSTRRALTLLASAYLGGAAMAATSAEPWLDPHRSPEERANDALKAMTLPEKLSLLHGGLALDLHIPGVPLQPLPAEAIPSAGYIPGVPRLHIPALFESDAGLGVANPLGARPGDVATAFPAGLVLAGTFDPELAYRGGTVMGNEAHAKGFDVLLAGGMDLTRDPRNGRNFEYLGEDPLLAGVIAGETVRGIQDQHVISTLKHYALNANETNRQTLDARIDKAALRESDLLAFQLAIERGRPGSIMCSYNKVNGDFACGNAWLLNDVLKRDWGYTGWVMSDWGAVHSLQDGLNGLDQESGEQLDAQVWFGGALKAALDTGTFPLARVDDMTRRVLRSLFTIGVVDHPPEKTAIDYDSHAKEALEVAHEGIVLLKNKDRLLPLTAGMRRIAIIGGNAHLGVLTGGGSSQVTPSNGAPISIPVGGRGVMSMFRNESFLPTSPLKAIQALAAQTEVVYDAGSFPADAAALAASADVAVVFATRDEFEGYDIPNLSLPNGQDALIDAVAAANSHTIVVLETGNPVSMPWLTKVGAVLAAWYPGQEGGRAIADILFGVVNPSGHLPMSWPIDDATTVRPQLPNFGVEPGVNVSLDYTEGANVGYRWYAATGTKPQFPFGYGLSYTNFAYDSLSVQGGQHLHVKFTVRNTGARAGSDVPQVYLTTACGKPDMKLIGFQRVSLQPGAQQEVELDADNRLLGHFDEQKRRFVVKPCSYRVSLGHSSEDLVLPGDAMVRGTVR